MLGHVNVNSLPNKLNHIRNLLEDNEVDILCVSETWLTADVYNSTVNIPGYNCIRADSPSGVHKHGSLIYVGSQVKFIETPCNVSNVVTILLPDYDVHLISVYLQTAL